MKSPRFVLFSVLFASFVATIVAECPNACSAHGKCGAYDMCTCFRNWMSNDCSERICQFGLAHVDSPKGDLDASGGKLTGPDSVIVVNDQMYPYGTTEQYPELKDTNGNILSQSGHEYRECSNKGICDRGTGTCACFEGYEGSACQRASCPSGPNGVCSGHGTCQTIAEISANDHDNIYRLWDQDATMGCVCDGGYEGADCSQRKCKVGVDPLYLDNNATVRYSNFTVEFYTLHSAETIIGNYSITFYDSFGEDWHTDPIDWDAECDEITTALESLPNNVIPMGSVRCYKYQVAELDPTYGQALEVHPIFDVNMYVRSQYSIAFPENPGKLKQIEINKYLDGGRPTLYSTTNSGNPTVGWHIFPNGFIGEDVDMVPDRCHGVILTIVDEAQAYTSYLDSLDADEVKLLKTCLGDSDGNADNNVEVYNWDYGDAYNPHLIKLQDATQYYPSLRLDPTTGLYNYDSTIYTVPTSLMCTNGRGSDYRARNEKRFGWSAEYDSNVARDLIYESKCTNYDPPGFYAVLYYEDRSDGHPFRLYTRAGNDYSRNTPFYIYTTTGYLNLVNPYAAVFTGRDIQSSADRINSYYSKTLGMAKNRVTVPSSLANFDGDMSCEGNPTGTYGARDCFNKDDYAIFLNTKNTTTGNEANPFYVNIYQIKKIWKENVVNTTDPYMYNDETRLKITLDYSMNAAYIFTNASTKDNTAQAYKFYPPTNTPFGGYKFALPCAGRGICNGDNGVCECFRGYADDDCTCINALSV